MTSGVARLLRAGVLLPVLLGCSGSKPPAEAPTEGPDIVIPEVTPEEAKSADKGPSAPAGRRDPVPTEPEPTPDYGYPEPPDPFQWGGSGPFGGPDCDQAANCCMKMSQSSGGPSVARVCGSIRNASSSMCSMLLTSFQQAASSSGITCP